MEFLKSANDYLNSNPWLNAIFLLLAIVSILASVIFYIKSRKSRIPTYIIRSINLVREHIKKIKSVEIQYLGNRVEDLTISKLMFWNAGKETIDSDDVANVDPIKIILINEAKILDAEILYQKNTANNFTIDILREIMK